MKLFRWIALPLSFMVLITACKTSETDQNVQGMRDTVPVLSQELETESLEPIDVETVENRSLEQRNFQTIAHAKEQKIEMTISCGEKYTIFVDADVDVTNIERVDCYEYVTAPMSNQQREALFEAYFGEKACEVEHNTYMYNDFWEIREFSAVTDYHTFNIQYDNSGPGIPNEKIFNLLNRGVYLLEFDTNQLDSLEGVNIELSLAEILSNCNRLISSITDCEQYSLDYIRPFGVGENRPFYWIVFSQSIDGMPITAYRDLKFYVDENGIEYFGGALYCIGRSIMDSPIITIDEAVQVFENQIADYFNATSLGVDSYLGSQIIISKVSLEYLVVNDITAGAVITPVWRFQLGADESGRCILRDRVIAVNAINGNLIVERRRNTF